MRNKNNRKHLEEKRQFEEAQGRLLEHAYAKGFYDGVEASGGVFVPGLGLVVGLLSEKDPLPNAFDMPGFIPELKRNIYKNGLNQVYGRSSVGLPPRGSHPNSTDKS